MLCALLVCTAQPVSEPQSVGEPQQCSSDGDSSEESMVVSGLQCDVSITDTSTSISDETRGSKVCMGTCVCVHVVQHWWLVNITEKTFGSVFK